MTTVQETMLKPGDSFEIRDNVWPLNLSPCKTGEIEDAWLDPGGVPVYRVWLDNYELTTVYGWEIEKL